MSVIYNYTNDARIHERQVNKLESISALFFSFLKLNNKNASAAHALTHHARARTHTHQDENLKRKMHNFSAR